MDSYFVVEEIQSFNWKPNLDIRKQNQWQEHADFMNNLEAEGFVVLGGPMYSENKAKKDYIHRALLIIDAESENTILKRFSEDPWIKNSLLKVNWIKKWDILLNRNSPVR